MTAIAPTLVVLAAGLGSRYGGLKQLDPMGPNGEPLLDYAVFDAQRAGFERVIFVIREELAETFERTIGARYRNRIQVEYAFQALTDIPSRFSVPAGRVRPWGTLHAVLAIRHRSIDGPFAVINADDFYGADAYQAVARFFAAGERQGGGESMCLVGYPLHATLSGCGGVNRGVCRERDGQLESVAEYRSIALESDGCCYGVDPAGARVQLDGDSNISMNCWGFGASVLAQMADHFEGFLARRKDRVSAECYILSFVDAAIASGLGKCRILETSGTWFGVTYPEDKPGCVRSLRALIDAGVYPEFLWQEADDRLGGMAQKAK